jgi:hypothetical protein
LVEPTVVGGLPATMVTSSPRSIRPRSSIALSTCSTISSVWVTAGTRNVSTPHTRASWLRTSATGVNASSGIGERCSASRRAVSPLCVRRPARCADLLPHHGGGPGDGPLTVVGWACTPGTRLEVLLGRRR